jgi:transposase
VARKTSSSAVDLDQIRDVAAALKDAGKHDEALEMVIGLVGQLSQHGALLEQRLAQVLRQLYGRRSEKIAPNQLALLLEELAAKASSDEAPPPPPRIEPSEEAKRARKPTGRKPLPAFLTREQQVFQPAADELVCDCGAHKKRIGAETSEMLEFVPASFKVIELVREKYACGACQAGVVIAPVPAKPIEGGLPGPGLIANTLIAKYKDGLPLNRLAGIYQRAGVEIAPSTLGDWVRGGAALVEPLAKHIFARVMASHVVQADDTGLRVLDPGRADGVKKGHLWGFVGDRRLVAFAYTETWEGARAREHLVARRGYLQVDGYAGLNPLFEGPDPPCVAVGCMAHCRRKFVVAVEGGDLRAAIAVDLIQKLYVVEREATADDLDHEARLARRRERSAPLMNELGAWIASVHPAAPPKTPLGKALTYAINQWRELMRFLEDGRLELDNNGVERALRPIAVGRKGWLFAGSDEGARRAAIVYTVIGSAVLSGGEPWAYLRAVVDELSAGVTADRLAELAPDRWAAAQAAAAAIPAADAAPAA